MRKDMYKIICERPRRGGGYSGDHHPYRKAKKVVLDDDLECVDVFSGRTKLPIKPIGLSWDDYKSFSDYLAPLYRFIDKKVGRLWDDVYAEICENITLDSTTRRHVRQHVDDYVTVNVIFNEHGDPCTAFGRRWGGYIPLEKGELYKDPVTGILTAAGESITRKIRREERLSYAREREVTTLTFSDGVSFTREATGENHKKYDGRTECWFKYYDVQVIKIKKIFVERGEHEDVYRYEPYVATERVRVSASTKDVKKYGLTIVP